MTKRQNCHQIWYRQIHFRSEIIAAEFRRSAEKDHVWQSLSPTELLNCWGFEGVGIEIEIGGEWFWKGALNPFRTMNYHDDQINNPVVPPKILLHKKNTKGLELFLWISCIYSLMSQQDKNAWDKLVR